MKTIKLRNEKASVNRELISKFGEAIYHSPQVESVLIQIEFKDGSGIRFKRAEMKDEIDRQINEMGEE